MLTAFVAGATGYTGQALLAELARGESPWQARPHARSAGKLDGAVVCDPLDVAALTDGMRGADAVVQLIGVTKKQFAQEMTYEKIDYGTTLALGEAARAAGVPRLLLLSSVMAQTRRNRYLRVKRETEEWVEKSGLEYTIVRPSFIVGPGRRPAQVLGALVAWSPSLRAIEVGDLAKVFVRALERREQVKNQILEGKKMWALVD